MRIGKKTALGIAAATLGGQLTGCKCSEDRPYTPFHITDAPGGSAASSAAPSPSAALAAEFVPRDSTPAPKDASEWTLEGVAMGLDKGRVFERAVAADFDGDGSMDAVAWTRAREAAPDAADTGEVVVFSAKNPAGRLLAKTPPFVPTGTACPHQVMLTQTGPHTVTLDVGARCTAALVPRSPVRGLLVLAPAGDRPTVLGLRIADPAPAESFTLAVDSRDRDGDGRDDVRVTTTLHADADPADVSADLVWLDRTAGASRDATEPSRSLASLASLEKVRAPGKSTSQKVPARVANARRLYSTLCAESGTARVFDADGAALPCGDMGAALGELTVADIRAAVASRDAVRAAGALGRALGPDSWYSPPLSPKTLATLEKELAQVAPLRLAVEKPLDVAPRARSGLPRWSPLAFDTDGSLLVETADGVSRVVLPDARVEDASEAVDAWPLTVGGGKDPRWTGVAFPCDRSEVLLLVSDATGTPQPSQPTRLLAPRPGPCHRPGAVPAPTLTPLEWSGTILSGFVAGALFGIDDLGKLPAAGAAPRGAPRSPDGKAIVVASPAGVVVQTAVQAPGTTEQWIADDPAALSDCVVANGAARVACIRGERAILLTPGERKSPKK